MLKFTKKDNEKMLTEKKVNGILKLEEKERRKSLNNEYYTSNEYNSFGEYKSFPAEQYAGGVEIAVSPPEHSKKGHEYQYEKPKAKKKGTAGIFKRLADKLTSTTRSIATAVACVGAAAVVTAMVIFNIAAPFPECEMRELYAGNDYVRYGAELSSFSEDVDYSLVIENSYHSFEFDVENEGTHRGLVTGLKPGLEYTIALVGKHNGNNQTYYEKQFYTTNSDTPEAVFDVSLSKNEDNALSAEYSVYLSDTYEKVENPYLELTQNGNVIYTDNNLKDGFFKGAIESLPTGNSTLVLAGDIDGVGAIIGKYEIKGLDIPVEPDERLPLALSPIRLVGVNLAGVDLLANRDALLELGAEEIWVRIIADGVIADEYSYAIDEVRAKSDIEFQITPSYSTVNVVVTAYNADTVSVFEAEQDIVLSQGVTGELYVNLYDVPSVNLSLKGVLPSDSVLVVTDQTNGTETEYAVYDSMYNRMNSQFSWDTGNGQVTYTYCIKNGNGEILFEGEAFEVDFTIEKSLYQISYQNPGDALITYNDDGTINVYIPVEFSSDDLDVYYEITLGTYIYTSKDYYFVAESIPNTTYALIYRVCKDVNGVKYVMGRTYPSGTVNEVYKPNVSADITDTTVHVYFEATNQYDFDGTYIVTSSGEEFTVSGEDVTYDALNDRYALTLSLESPCDEIVVRVKAAHISTLALERLEGIEKKGSLYTEWEFVLY